MFALIPQGSLGDDVCVYYSLQLSPLGATGVGLFTRPHPSNQDINSQALLILHARGQVGISDKGPRGLAAGSGSTQGLSGGIRGHVGGAPIDGIRCESGPCLSDK